MTTDHPNYAPLSTPATPRLVSLDVLRGLAILLMIFSGMIPKTLPNWMDHGYQPHFMPDVGGIWRSVVSPDGDVKFEGRWKAFTWVDLVFPMFLFSMGAAIPIAMGRRLARGASPSSLLAGIVARWLMLIAFAVLIDNIGPPAFDGLHDDARRLLTLVGFGLAFLFFVRWPDAVPTSTQRGIRWLTGAMLVALFVAYAVQRAHLGEPFSWSRRDIIILLLAHAYLVASVAWLFTSNRPWLRLALLAPFMLAAHYLAISTTQYPDWLWMGSWPSKAALFTMHGQPWTLFDVLESPKSLLNLPARIPALATAARAHAWVGPAADLSPLWDFTWLKFLWVVIPGTIVGDWLGRASAAPVVPDPPRMEADASVTRPYPRGTILALALATTIATCVGLRHYGFATLGVGGPLRTPWLAPVLALPLASAMTWLMLTRAPRDSWPLVRICRLGIVLLVVGLALACLPSTSTKEGFFEGGISKGPPATLSYYATATGLCCLLLTGLLGALDFRPASRRRLGLLEANGQNPLLAYFLAHVVIGVVFGLGLFTPLRALAGSDDHWWSRVDCLDNLGQFPGQPWQGALWGAMKTLLIAGVVWALTRRRIFWRA